MTSSALETFIDAIARAWGPLTTERVERIRGLVESLAQAPATEPWLAALHARPPEDGVELHRSPEHGYVLLAYSERQGRYRAPHDHGRGWVIYTVQRGQMEMGEYGKVTDVDGTVRVVRRAAYRMNPGDARVFLPGDIHDTRCLSDSVLVFRLTSRDLRQEEAAGCLTRYSSSTW